MALLEETGTERKEVRTERGAVRCYTVSPVAYVSVISGHMEPDVSDLLIAYGTERMRRATGSGKKVYVFQDWLDMTGYESVCRQRLTTWALENIAAIGEVHLAQGSKLVGMGVQVANLALGGLIRTHSDRTSMEKELRRVIRETSSPSKRA